MKKLLITLDHIVEEMLQGAAQFYSDLVHRAGAHASLSKL